MLEEIVDVMDPSKDFEGVDKRIVYKAKDGKELIYSSLRYARSYFSRLPKHFIRGAIHGAIAGGIYSLISGDFDDVKDGAILGSGFDYLQFTFRWINL
jgi:hypothetical protein